MSCFGCVAKSPVKFDTNTFKADNGAFTATGLPRKSPKDTSSCSASRSCVNTLKAPPAGVETTLALKLLLVASLISTAPIRTSAVLRIICKSSKFVT